MSEEILEESLEELYEDETYYSEKLEDYEPSPCPYCGLPRVVWHLHSDIYEDPDEYLIEHENEAEAAQAGCFALYFSFSTPEQAIEKANMRAK